MLMLATVTNPALMQCGVLCACLVRTDTYRVDASNSTSRRTQYRPIVMNWEYSPPSNSRARCSSRTIERLLNRLHLSPPALPSPRSLISKLYAQLSLPAS